MLKINLTLLLVYNKIIKNNKEVILNMIKLKNESSGVALSFLVLSIIITPPFLYFSVESIKSSHPILSGIFFLVIAFIFSLIAFLFLSFIPFIDYTVLVKVGEKELLKEDLQDSSITKNTVELKHKTASKEFKVEDIKYIYESPEAEEIYLKMKESVSTSDWIEKVEIVKYLRIRKFLINLFSVELEEQYKAILTYKRKVNHIDKYLKQIEDEKALKEIYS